MNSYPAWRFHSDGMSVVVISAEEDSLLGEAWTDQVHEGFDPEKAPTYQTVEHVPAPIDVDAIAEQVKRKPGRPRKVEP